jgi:hypothetical protein
VVTSADLGSGPPGGAQKWVKNAHTSAEFQDAGPKKAAAAAVTVALTETVIGFDVITS